MNTQELKLAIIQKVTACKDPELLQTIHQILARLSLETTFPPPAKLDQQAMLNALLQERTSETNSSTPDTEELKDLQDSIDEIFGKP